MTTQTLIASLLVAITFVVVGAMFWRGISERKRLIDAGGDENEGNGGAPGGASSGKGPWIHTGAVPASITPGPAGEVDGVRGGSNPGQHRPSSEEQRGALGNRGGQNDVPVRAKTELEGPRSETTSESTHAPTVRESPPGTGAPAPITMGIRPVPGPTVPVMSLGAQPQRGETPAVGSVPTQGGNRSDLESRGVPGTAGHEDPVEVGGVDARLWSALRSHYCRQEGVYLLSASPGRRVEEYRLNTPVTGTAELYIAESNGRLQFLNSPAATQLTIRAMLMIESPDRFWIIPSDRKERKRLFPGEPFQLSPDLLGELRTLKDFSNPNERVIARDNYLGDEAVLLRALGPDSKDAPPHRDKFRISVDRPVMVGRFPSPMDSFEPVRLPLEPSDPRVQVMSAEHAELWLSGGTLYVRSRGRNGTFVNQIQVPHDSVYALQPEDYIQFSPAAVYYVRRAGGTNS